MIKTWTSHLKIANYLLLIVVLFLAGCASAPGPVNVKGEAVSDIYSVFTNGEIRLACNSPSCAGGFGSIRREAKIFYDNGLWKDLVYAVAGVGYKEDLAYFYLGAAAENLGYWDAAQTYYRLADTVHKCDGWLNNCDGFDIRALLSQARIRISLLRLREHSLKNPNRLNVLPNTSNQTVF
jgi:hypothetical protein